MEIIHVQKVYRKKILFIYIMSVSEEYRFIL